MKNSLTFYFKMFSLHFYLLILFGNTILAQEPDWLDPVPDPFGLSAPMGEDTISRVILADIDHDDTLEAFIHIIENIPPFSWQDLRYYENMQTDEDPLFEFVETFPFGIPNTSNWLRQFADVNVDGKEDFVTNSFINFNNPVTLIYNSGPSEEEPVFSGSLVYNPYGITLPVASDNGNVLDRVIPNFVDIDSDGDLDLFYGGLFFDNEYNEAFYFSENISDNPAEPDYAAPVPNPYGLTYPQSIISLHVEAFADVDCDGDLDMYYQGRSGGQNFYYFFENTGSPTLPDFSSMYTPTPVLGVMGSFVDIGGDGDLDLITFKVQGGQGVWFYENQSYPEVVDFDTTSNGSTYTFTNNSSDRPIRYHWDFGDGDTSVVENPEHTYTQSGLYNVCLTAGGGMHCQNTACKTIDVVVSTKELYLDAKLKLYPNPAGDFLTFELESHENLDRIEIEIFNLVGQKTKSLSVNSFNNTLQKTISLKDMYSGLYMLKVNSRDKFLVHKFVKQ